MKNNSKNENQYDDIIHLKHHVSQTHTQMSRIDRAAQFSPFAALTGFDGTLKETARRTEERIELDETSKVRIDEKIQIIQERINQTPEVEIRYFQADERKSGGVYVTVKDRVKKIDVYRRDIMMQDGTMVAIDEIIDISGEMFHR